MRKFEICSAFADYSVNLPKRKTRYSAGYDFEVCKDISIPPFSISKKPTLVPTGIKAKFPSDEYLMLVNRSSSPIKKGLILSNGVGIIDADYYNNPDNEGHIMFQFINITDEYVELKKGDAIGQGIFQKYFLTDNDSSSEKRTGGFGSTGG